MPLFNVVRIRKTRALGRPRAARIAEGLGRTAACARTEASASAKNAFSSGVPTVIRSAPGAPKPPIGRTIAPWRSSAS